MLAIFDLQVTPMCPAEFRVSWPFGSLEEGKTRLSRWWPSWISNLNTLSYFWSTSHPDASYYVSSQLAFLFRKKKQKKIFKIAAIVAILDSDQNDFRFWSEQYPSKEQNVKDWRKNSKPTHHTVCSGYNYLAAGSIIYTALEQFLSYYNWELRLIAWQNAI